MAGPTATFTADFTKWNQALASAKEGLKAFELSGKGVQQSLERMAKSFSGVEIKKQAELAAAAVEKIGGVTKLTEAEQRKLNATVSEGIAKYKALGEQAPAHLQKLQGELSGIKKGTGEAGTATSGLIAQARGLAGAFAGAFTVQKVGQFIGDLIETSGHLKDLSARTGISVTALQQLGGVAADAGVDVEQLSGLIEQMQKRLATDPGASKAVKELGLNIKDIVQMAPDRQFVTLASAIAGIQDPLERARVGTELFGKQWATVSQMASADMASVVASTSAMSDETVEILDGLGDKWGQFWRGVQNVGGNVLANMIVPQWLRVLTGEMKPPVNFGNKPVFGETPTAPDLPDEEAMVEINAQLTAGLERSRDAHKASEKAAQDHQKAIAALTTEQERQISVLEKAGVITGDVLVKKLGVLVETLNMAAREGTPALAQAVRNVSPDFDKLADAAQKAGIEVSVVRGVFNAFAGEAGLASLASRRIGAELTNLAPTLASNTNLTIEQSEALSRAGKEASITTDAYHRMGLKTREELEQLAAQAEADYERIAASVGKHAPEAEAAYRKMIEAHRAATGELPSYWETEVLPRIQGVAQNITASISDALGRILVGAGGFKESFLDVWRSIQRSIADILSSILNDFINRFLKGLLNALTGARGGFSSAFSGLFGGGGGGGLLTNGGGMLGALFAGGGGFASPIGANIAPSSMFGMGGGMGGGSALAGLAGGVGAGAAGLGLGFLGQNIFGGAGAGAATFGAGSGFATGALIGSIVPGIGTLIGGIIGGLSGVLGGLLGDTKAMKANDNRDAFISQFGGAGTGAGSGFATLAATLTQATGEAGGGRLFQQLIGANDPQKVAAAIAAVTAELERYAQKTAAVAKVEADHATAMESIKAKFGEQIDIVQRGMASLKQQVEALDASEAPEKHMGTVEKRARARIKAEEEILKKQLANIEQEKQKAIEAEQAKYEAARQTAEQIAALPPPPTPPVTVYHYRWQLDGEGPPVYEAPERGSGGSYRPPGYAQGGVVRPLYAATGMMVPFLPRGTDTVPAMLTPGEGVITRRAMQSLGADGLAALNRGTGNDESLLPRPSVPYWAEAHESPALPLLQSVTILEVDKREIGRAIADILPGELRRLGIRVRT